MRKLSKRLTAVVIAMMCSPSWPQEGSGGQQWCNEPAQTVCAGTLYYRPLSIPGLDLIFNHAFWSVLSITGSNSGFPTSSIAVLDGGPQHPHNSPSGFLQAHYLAGEVGFYAEDNVATASLSYSTGLSQINCQADSRMTSYTQNFPQTTYLYSATSQNSNTLAHWIGNAGGLTPPAPPSTPGW